MGAGSGAICGLGALSGIALGRDPLRINHGESFAPFNWRTESGELRGILLDILTEAFEQRLGIPVRHDGFPWLRAQKLVEEGLADALCTVPTPERLAFAEASAEPVATSPFTLFCRRDNPLLDRLRQAKTLADLRPFHLVHYLGSSWAKQNLAAEQMSWGSTQNAALAMVAARRGDAIIDSSIALRWAIRQLGLQDQLIELPQVFTQQSFNLLIRKSSPDVAALRQFDQALRRMRADGAIRRILESYDVGQPLG
ncbi:MAG TPA: transporter substrate-binding domain-containing protein [Paucimonas sp.]|nr:transporter substrate-binding domain-containing protein [Paucimonas sp.]